MSQCCLSNKVCCGSVVAPRRAKIQEQARRAISSGAGLALMLACLVSLAPAQDVLAPRAGAQTPDIQEVLGCFAHGQQTVRVLVQLDDHQALAMAAPSLAQPQAAAALRRQMRSLQDAAIAQFQPAELKIAHRYENIPGFSADVTLDVYQRLTAMPGVASVALARDMNLHMRQGIPLIGGSPIRRSYFGAGVAVAVVDSGLDYTHPSLGNGSYPNAKVLGGYDFGDNDPDPRALSVAHGTAVAGIIAGDPATSGPADYVQVDSGSGGVAYGARIYALKVTAGDGASAKLDAVIAAWDWCITHKNDNPANPILVINTSLGAGQYTDQITCSNASPLMAAAARLVTAYGMAITASAGNDGTTNSLALPACLADVISVGAVYDDAIGSVSNCPGQSTNADVPICYGNVAPFMDMLAPAEWATTLDIVGPEGDDPGDFNSHFGDTSAASAYAAGSVALLQSAAKAIKGRFLPVSTVRRLLTKMGDPITIESADNIKKPRINLGQAIANMPDFPPSSYLLPPVIDQGFMYVPPNAPYAFKDFSNGYGVSVAFALGYYYKTFQDAKRMGLKPEELVANPQYQVSPYFMFTNGGTDYMILAGEMLKGTGSPSLFKYPGYNIEPTQEDLDDAANHRILDYTPFFYHRPVASKAGRFLGGAWSNNTTVLANWIKSGEMFVLGLPVYDSFAKYSPAANETDVRKIIYDGPASGESLAGFHMVCVVDYLESIHAFKIVNDWGTEWGVNPNTGTSVDAFQDRGYGWLSGRFVQKYGIEAWSIRSANTISHPEDAVPRGKAQVTESTDYWITYVGPGILDWTTASLTGDVTLQIFNGGFDDTLSIVRKKGIKIGDTIPLVLTDGSLKKLYTEAPIASLAVAGRLASLTTRDCSVAEIVTTKSLGLVRMSARPNSTWPELASSHYQHTYVRKISVSLPDQGVGMKLFNRLYTTVRSNLDNIAAQAEKPAIIQLSGVVLKDLRVGSQAVQQIATTSKKYAALKPDMGSFVAYGAMDDTYKAEAQKAAAKSGSGVLAGAMPSKTAAAANTGDVPRIIEIEEILKRFADAEIQGAASPKVDVIVTLKTSGDAAKAIQSASVSEKAALRAQVKAAQDTVISDIGGAMTVRHRFDNIAAFSASVTMDEFEKLIQHSQVAAINPVRILHPNLAQGIPLMNASSVRNQFNGAGIAIAITDTGVDYTHPQLGGGGFPNSKVIGGHNFGENIADPKPLGESHGTACAGIAAGDLITSTPVGDYIGGVAVGARIYAVKITTGDTGRATEDALIAAWDWCVTHQRDSVSTPIMVISTSFGGGLFDAACDDISPAMTQAARNAVAAGITVFASSGNDGSANSVAWPSCISDVISVGAVYDANIGPVAFDICSNNVTAADEVTCYSNTAAILSVLAPSHNAYTLNIVGGDTENPGSSYKPAFGGTSAACPYAAGAAACLQSAAKAQTGAYLTPQRLRSLMQMTGDRIVDPKAGIAKPRVNVGRAVQYMAIPAAVDVTDKEGVKIPGVVTPNGNLYKIQVTPLFTVVRIDCAFSRAVGSLSMTLLDASFNTLASSRVLGDHEFLEFDVTNAGIYYVYVFSSEGASGLPFEMVWDDVLVPSSVSFDRQIQAGDIKLISAVSGNVNPGALFSTNLEKVTGKGGMFTLIFNKRQINLPQPGDLTLGIVVNRGPSLSLSSVGGIVTADRILCGGEIKSIASRVARFRVDHFDRTVQNDTAFTSSTWYHGGVVGYAPQPTSLIPPAFMRVVSGVEELPTAGAPSFDIKSVTADIAIFGIFAARPQEVAGKLDAISAAANIVRMQTGRDTGAIKKQYQDVWWYRIQGIGYTSTLVNPVSGVVVFEQNPSTSQ